MTPFVSTLLWVLSLFAAADWAADLSGPLAEVREWREAAERAAAPEWTRGLPTNTREMALYLSPEEQSVFRDYVEKADAAKAAGDDEALWREVVAYIERSKPNGIRSNMIWNLAKRAREAGDPEEALEWWRKLEAEGVNRHYRGRAIFGQMSSLHALGRRQEALDLGMTLRRAGYGGVEPPRQIGTAHNRSRLPQQPGEVGDALKSFLSQSPPPGDRAAEDKYLAAAVRLGEELHVRGNAVDAHDFHRQVLDRYPHALSPRFLLSAYRAANGVDDIDAKQALVDTAGAKFPNAPETGWLRYTLARELLHRADRLDRPRGVELMKAVAESAGAVPAVRRVAIRELRQVGVEVEIELDAPEPVIIPQPGPLFDLPPGDEFSDPQ